MDAPLCDSVCAALDEHVRRFFAGRHIDVLTWHAGPIRDANPHFRVPRVAPAAARGLWHYVSVGGWAATAIYFLLGPGEESRWHTVRSGELWLWHRGGPLALRLGGTGDAPGPVDELILGPDVEAGQRPQTLVPPGVWQSARPAGTEPVLVSCVVAPGFDFADFRLG